MYTHEHAHKNTHTHMHAQYLKKSRLERSSYDIQDMIDCKVCETDSILHKRKVIEMPRVPRSGELLK